MRTMEAWCASPAKNEWMGAAKDDTFRQGAINNVKAFIDSIQNGKPLNNTEAGGGEQFDGDSGPQRRLPRTRTIAWDELLRSEEKFETKLKLRW
jgi:hypothetical protein